MYGSDRARWAGINSSGSERAHWLMVSAICKNRETAAAPAPVYSGSDLDTSWSPKRYSHRRAYVAGSDSLCVHCKKDISYHTPSKKYCSVV